MNPALSVIFFTTLSGAGYGLLAWTALAALLGQPARPLLVSLAVALALVSAGLLSSLAHLGKPRRAWRALSQWRTSWLSREGVASLLTYVPALLLAVALLPGMISADASGSVVALNLVGRLVALALIASALATVACTAMIYACLKPIPAWRHRLVVPMYLLFALLCGGLSALALLHAPTRTPWLMLAGLGAIGLATCKWLYWRDIDRTALPATRGDAVGLPARTVTVFERPHTEANYLTREMAFVLARRQATPLRWLATVLFALLPIACLLFVWFNGGGAAWFAAAAVSSMGGAFVERWLFFAQARHLVTLYY
ncbi:dimethyl sulfoxide reductase anchor subunit family protein [Cognatiluteimonas profundi]|uniref:dimethyl sulfoxide reductase anchor subunit family protein n=1 Tax=Cognatiluteimonas profundi TaxID=2594501 RepID=UPI00131CD880|nr:DmsC/YnfH family molybdoenzyme membrane anchor subunit [Lysobacter profundi]